MKKTVFSLLLLCLLCLGVALAEDNATLSYGSTGEAVLTLQTRLTELGYYTFRITGNYQENTQSAVRAFQAAHGLAETGTADAALQALILSVDAMPKAYPTPAPDMQTAFPGKLSYGSTGEYVRRIQARLAELGYYQIEITGNYLENTRNAVRNFQSLNALQVDGVVGSETWQWLFFEADTVNAYATPRPTPEPTPIPYRIGVDITNQVTTIYGVDEALTYTQVVKHMLCSTGTESDPTPMGSYILNGATSRWCYFPKWGTHAQYWTRIDAYNAFHSVIYSAADAMTLKTSSYTGLGKRASHGCIRLMVEDAKWIYENCGEGTEVVVYEGDLDEELTKSLKIPPLDKSVMLPEPTAAPTPSPSYDPEALPPMPFKTLQRGTESEAVYWLQSKLADLGYYNGTITGGYYQGTVDAVKAYQRDNGLSADGKAGNRTLNALYADVLATPTIPLPEAESTQAPSIQPLLTAKPSETSSVQPEMTPTATAMPSPAPDASEDASSLYVPFADRLQQTP